LFVVVVCWSEEVKWDTHELRSFGGRRLSYSRRGIGSLLGEPSEFAGVEPMQSNGAGANSFRCSGDGAEFVFFRGRSGIRSKSFLEGEFLFADGGEAFGDFDALVALGKRRSLLGVAAFVPFAFFLVVEDAEECASLAGVITRAGRG
jgi:hypothetical protein